MERMHEGNLKIREEANGWKMKYDSLKKFAQENNISIPAALEAI